VSLKPSEPRRERGKDILARYQHIVQSLTLATGSKGVFDVAVDGNIIYSKAETGRHGGPGEVPDLSLRITDKESLSTARSRTLAEAGPVRADKPSVRVLFP
jgi:selenoprotein W-related protein